jgi:hypothetical protein
MGAERELRARIAGVADRGRALLETNEVIFRGTRRCVVKLDAVRARAKVTGGWLHLGELELELGPKDAAAWLQKIKNPKSVLDKLGVKAGQRALLINWDDPSFGAELEQRGIELISTAKGADAIFFRVTELGALQALPRLRKAMPDHCALWLLRPKGKGAPVGERDTLAAGKAVGLVDVKVVGFSAELSAEKYVVPLAKRK